MEFLRRAGRADVRDANGGVRNAFRSGKTLWNSAATSGPTSKQHGPMHGPIAAMMASGPLPKVSRIAPIAAAAMFWTVPRQPA